jgi:hypothetical protein
MLAEFPLCELRMMTNGVSEGPNGSKLRVFECLKCGHIENNAVASDPLNNPVGFPAKLADTQSPTK